MNKFVRLNTGGLRSDRPLGYYIRPSGCWEWSGKRDKRGYGNKQIHKPRPTSQQAHRWVYEKLVGPIPKGLTLDHLCRNRLCVNPDHLEPVTSRENILRGTGGAALNARKTHCKRGHPFDAANTFSSPSAPTKRQCRVCRRLREGQRRRGKLKPTCTPE